MTVPDSTSGPVSRPTEVSVGASVPGLPFSTLLSVSVTRAEGLVRPLQSSGSLLRVPSDTDGFRGPVSSLPGPQWVPGPQTKRRKRTPSPMTGVVGVPCLGSSQVQTEGTKVPERRVGDSESRQTGGGTGPRPAVCRCSVVDGRRVSRRPGGWEIVYYEVVRGSGCLWRSSVRLLRLRSSVTPGVPGCRKVDVNLGRGRVTKGH